MEKQLLKKWGKVFEDDLNHLINELEEFVDLPALIVLEGEVGAGKTTFTRHFLKNEGGLSPTYSVLTETSNTLHADFYRLENASEIFGLEIPLYLEEKEYFFVEWGMKYIKELWREIPEDFSCYLLEIEMNEAPKNLSDSGKISRNFFFHSLTFD